MKAFNIANRLIRQIAGDKRTIGLLLFAPVFVIYLFSIIFTSSASTANIDVISAPDNYLSILKNEADVTIIDNEATALERLKNHESDAYIIFDGNQPIVTVEGADPAMTKLVATSLSKVTSEAMTETFAIFNAHGQMINMPAKPQMEFLYGSEDLETFDSFAPMMMGYFIFFFVFLLAGISFLRERISGTLDRVLATPIRRSEIVGGYFLGFGLFVVLQTFIIQAFMLYILHVEMAGSFWIVLLVNLILAGGSLALGTLLSAFAANEFQLFQFIPLVIIPQIFFSGIFNLREAPQWVVFLSKIFPMTYAAEALRNIMIRGYGFSEIFKDCAILFGYMVLFLILNILVLKKYRKI